MTAHLTDDHEQTLFAILMRTAQLDLEAAAIRYAREKPLTDAAEWARFHAIWSELAPSRESEQT